MQGLQWMLRESAIVSHGIGIAMECNVANEPRGAIGALESVRDHLGAMTDEINKQIKEYRRLERNRQTTL